MRLLKFFCFKWTIATGVQVTGYLNIMTVLLLIALYSVLELYQYFPLIIFPIICFMVFHKMMKKDGIKQRRKNFLWYLAQTVIIDAT